MFGQSDMFFYF